MERPIYAIYMYIPNNNALQSSTKWKWFKNMGDGVKGILALHIFTGGGGGGGLNPWAAPALTPTNNGSL